MSNIKRKWLAPLSGLSVRKKFILLYVFLLLAIITAWAAMANTIKKVSSDRYDRLEKTAITATEQMTSIGFESAVSIAKNIYTNKPVYEFLNKEYSSSSEYFELYYPLLQNSALNTTDTNIVKKCTIYTSNPTILSGGAMGTIDSVQNEEWYKTIKKLNKPTILNIDHRDGSIVLVRKLDYVPIDKGENYLCLKLNRDFINNFAKSIDFDGQLYIMSGNNLLYSSDEKVRSVSDVSITPDFEGVTHNFYTVDIEFYACTNKVGLFDLLIDNKYLLPCLIAILVLFNITIIFIGWGITRRIKPVLKEFSSKGSIHSLEKGKNGKDEIGLLLDVCAEMAERLTQKGSEYKESSDSLMKKSSDYNSLFTTAMRLDAELAVMNRMPYLHTEELNENITLADEAKLLEKTAAAHRAEFRNSGTEYENVLIPAYSFALIAEDIISNYSDILIDIRASEKEAAISFESGSSISPADKLKLYAIFEDDDITGEYSFEKSYRFNPYLRIKHCLGSSVEIKIIDKDEMKVTFIIRYEKEKGE